MNSLGFCSEFSMILLWILYDFSMNSLWIFFDIIETVLPGECSYCKKIKIDLFSMTFLWILYDFSMNSLWFCYEFSMILLWILYDFSMNSLWIFFDIIDAVLPGGCSYCKKFNIGLGLLHLSTYTIIGCNGNMRYNRLLPNAHKKLHITIFCQNIDVPDWPNLAQN